MKPKYLYTLLIALVSLTVSSCKKNSDDLSIPVNFDNLSTDNRGGGGTSKLILTFDRTIDGLSADNIELNGGTTGAQKGTLTKVAVGTYELELHQVRASGEVTITVTCPGYSITSSQKTVAIGFKPGVITNTSLIKAIEKRMKFSFSKNEAGHVVVADNQAKINSITQLDVSGLNLSSMEGIEHFTHLQVLNCSNNKLPSLDLSKNTALAELQCVNNKLQSLDLSKNTLLETFQSQNNQLATLDLSKNTALKKLNCSYNQLTTLDVSKNTLLDVLACNANQLTTLDLSKNTALELLWCFSNKLQSLDVSKLPKFEPIDQFNVRQSSTIELKVTAAQKALIDADQTSWAANNKVTVVVAP